MAGSRREKWVAFAFVAPATILIGLFVLLPALNMLLTSTQQQSLTARDGGTFIGIENYRLLAADPAFIQSVRNTAWFALAVTILQTLVALALASWANGPGFSRRFLRWAIFLPTTISLAVLSVLWKLMYEPASATGTGLVNGLIGSVGLPTQPFLTNPHQALPAIVFMSIWQGVGLQMMIFLAGLQSVPAELYEAAQLDGAGRPRRFAHITLPHLAPTVVFVVTITAIFGFRLFVQPFLMTRGGPQGATMSLLQYIYETAFFQRDLGLACAAGVVLFVVVLSLTVLLRWLMRRVEAVP